jgi:hypothetical protein
MPVGVEQCPLPSRPPRRGIDGRVHPAELPMRSYGQGAVAKSADQQSFENCGRVISARSKDSFASARQRTMSVAIDTSRLALSNAER